MSRSRIEDDELRLRRVGATFARTRDGMALVPLGVVAAIAEDITQHVSILDTHHPSWRDLPGMSASDDNRQRARGKLRRAGERSSGVRGAERREAPT